MKNKHIENYYDTEDFFHSYISYRNKYKQINNLEIKNTRKLMPEIKEKSILDIGCGYGDMCQWLAKKGAKKVIGIDPSENMLELARSKSKLFNNITYIKAAIEDYVSEEYKFDVVISSLCIHYIPNMNSVFKKVKSLLNEDGKFIFSQEHPICTAYAGMDLWIKDNNGNEYCPVDSYNDEGARQFNWLNNSIVKYHRKLETIINYLIESNFYIEKIIEPEVKDNLLNKYGYLTKENKRPRFLIISAGIKS